MTFYQQQVQYLKKSLYPKDYLLTQIIQSKKFIDNNYADNINLDDIAGEAFFSKFHFIINKEYERLGSLGVTFSMKPTQIDPVTLAVFGDTCRNNLQIYQL